MKKLTLILFIIHLITRFIFILINGFFNNYGLQSDSVWLVEFGMNAAQFNFNFELERFVASPLFPTIVGLLKTIFANNWNIALIIIQLFLSALSGVYLYKIGEMLFNKKIGILASLIFSIFPMTLWFTNTFSQECIFQSLFIFSIYFLIKSVKYSSLYSVIISSVFFSLAYLTKSHILLFSFFIPLIFFHYFKFRKQTLIYSVLYGTIALFFTLPYGIYSYNIHNQYILSSNGAGYQFYLGNTEAGYKTVVNVPKKNSDEFKKLQNINVTAGYFNGSQSHYDSILLLPQKEKQTFFFNEAFYWIKNNPLKFIELKIYNTVLYILPGVSWRHYSFYNWLFSFAISLPIYLLAYISIFKMYKTRQINVIFIQYIFLTMLLFSTIWYVQNRFRTITIEPFYIVYAAYTLAAIIEKKMPATNRRLAAMAGDAEIER